MRMALMMDQETPLFTEDEKRNLLWFAEKLETTKLPEGEGTLRKKLPETPGRTGEFCALGIYAWYHPQGVWRKIKHSYGYTFLFEGEHFSEVLPPKLIREFGGYKHVPDSNYVTIWAQISLLNDNHSYSFGEIARELRHLAEEGDWTRTTKKILRENGEL